MAGRFEGKVAIITGSSNGIGRGIAVLFAKEGAKVTLTGRSEQALQETVKEITSAGIISSSHLAIVKGDLREESTQKEILQRTLDTFGKIDILINNAGGVGPDMCGRNGFEQSMDDFNYVFDLNLKAVVSLTRMALPHLIQSKGDVVMISSIAGLPTAATKLPYYGMTKSALDQYTRTLAIEVIKDGVRVNSINPGIICTEIYEKQGANKEDLARAFASDPLAIPAGYYGLPEDIAHAAAFLCDRRVSRYIVGHTLVIDGGSSLVTKCLNCDIMGFAKEANK